MDHEQEDPEFEATVSRAEGVPQLITAGHQAELNRMVEEACVTADLQARVNDLELQALAPLLELVERNPKAQAAAQEMQQLNLEAMKRTRVSSPMASGHGADLLSDPRGSLHPAKPGLNIFGPPYDWKVLGPTQGKHAHAESDLGTGRFAVHFAGTQGGNAHGRRVATAGVSMALQAKAGGFARIAPLLKYDYRWSIYASFLSAFTEGWCELVVQDGSGTVLPQGHKVVRLWSHTSQTSASGEYADQIYVPDIETTVALSAGQVFHVTLLGTAVVVDSGQKAIGYSFAHANNRLWAPFFTVTL